MTTATDETRVIFRMIGGAKRGECIALFPDLAGNSDTSTCLSYMHIGQHSAASLYRAERWPLATAEQSAELRAELVRIGYTLREVKRTPRNSRALRAAQLVG